MGEDERRRMVVVVGVDGSSDSERAVRYAVTDALRSGRRVRLVHVVPEAVPMAAMLPLYGADSLEAVGRRILADAEEEVARLSGEVPVETALAHGARHHALLAHTHDAALVVLGRRPSLLAHIRTGSTSSAVAARAGCPVVSVPEEWTGAEPHGRVIAAVDGCSASPAVLRAGFVAAQERDAELVVLHAWRPMAPYESALAGARVAETWEKQAEPVLWAMLAGLRADFAAVPVTVELRYERTVDALVAAGRHADLLVMGRRGDGPSFGSLLGAKPRALLRAGVCPVEIVPAPDAETPRVPPQATQRRGTLRSGSSPPG